MFQNLSSAAVVFGALRVNCVVAACILFSSQCSYCQVAVICRHLYPRGVVGWSANAALPGHTHFF